ncbi:copper amine oxidase [Cohnella sp. CFH 77786]|uniref:copper amine oxidase N-terminal domain-containing protein n=1 Tax=Cohnella sp. CFH 77786 TaxID=2662265 RepID=UPI001C609AAD|nr:copper amine oxidase N-terminal domain-containing protein [Cohnella sp. CFH 77786]MBW5444735.1 copper amine oxidase [Cohnella sp. CFH 77786]
MKVRKIVILTAALTLAFGSAVFADTVTQKLKVFIDRKEASDAGIMVDNKAYLAVGAFAKSLQAMVSWDNDEKKVTIFKPNVHMITMKDNATFGSVTSGRTQFLVFAQIDSLKTDISAFKVTITDPYGDETLIDGRDSGDKDFPSGKEDFWFKTKEISYDFTSKGQYLIRFWMKMNGDSSMQVVSEKVIASK